MTALTAPLLLIPRLIVRLTFGPPAPHNLYEPTVCAWFGTILEEINTFGTTQ